MRKGSILLLGIVVSLTLANTVLAQVEKGQTELSFAAAFMGVKGDDGDMSYAFNISGRMGYLVTSTFEFEPEIIFSTYEDEDPGIILAANLLYNISLPDADQITPFLLAGLGWSNSAPLFNQTNFGDAGRDYTLLNLGLGMRFFLSNSSALRLEYRFQRFSTEEERWYFDGYTGGYDPSVSYHNVLFGMALFLK
jgi:opacity protein-like surface antigen